MTRRPIAIFAMVGALVLIALDLQATPANPYAAPPMIALGSGVASAGGFCGQLPQ